LESDIFGDSDDEKCLDRRAARLRVEEAECSIREERERDGGRGEEEEEGEGRTGVTVGGASVADVLGKAVDTQRENQHDRVKGARPEANGVRDASNEPDVAAGDMWREEESFTR
jgi:hypothetical protein